MKFYSLTSRLGSIATLKEVMEFYNKRDLEPDRWGPTDYPETVNHDDMGDLDPVFHSLPESAR